MLYSIEGEEYTFEKKTCVPIAYSGLLFNKNVPMNSKLYTHTNAFTLKWNGKYDTDGLIWLMVPKRSAKLVRKIGKV